MDLSESSNIVHTVDVFFPKHGNYGVIFSKFNHLGPFLFQQKKNLIP